MSDKPRNRWFRGDGTKKRNEDMDTCVLLYRAGAGKSVFVLHNLPAANWLECWEYAIVPVENLKLDIEEPEPELVKVAGCDVTKLEPSSIEGVWIAKSKSGDLRVVLVCHPDKNVAIEAHNAAAEALNKHGGGAGRVFWRTCKCVSRQMGCKPIDYVTRIEFRRVTNDG